MRGVLVVDKPSGMTSHDVVSKVRKAFDTRAVGHAGTLDPMATGVLVIGIGRGTKLVPWLTAMDKTYETTIRLGVATHSLDADGDVVEEKPVPPFTLEEAVAAAESLVGTRGQKAPAVSAIKVDGRALHERVRRGEAVDAPVREVTLHSVQILAVDATSIRARLHSGKGFYVRSFGRDLAEKLGTVGHLTSLRRTASGAFSLDEAVTLDALPTPLLTLAGAAARLMPTVKANDEGVEDARHGRRIAAEDVDAMPAGDAALIHEGELIAVVFPEEGKLRVKRGFVG